MYRHCIFCSADLGANEALEGFPVGRRVAFDARRGRLWAVCLQCSRWNLSPIEERWEPVEAAERTFRDARLKVQSERVGLARLPDGTSLVRVGEALPGELAAWRYGSQLLQRRRRARVAVAAGSVAWTAMMAGMWATSGVVGLVSLAHHAWLRHHQRRVLFRIDPADDPTGRGAILRNWHAPWTRIHTSDDGELVVRVEHGWRDKEPYNQVRYANDDHILAVTGAPARGLLARAMPRINRKGASPRELDGAMQLLADAGDADRLVQQTASRSVALGYNSPTRMEVLKGPVALALEMALHEQAERVALQGELADLERAWKEAEEIAAIADSLPGEATLNRLLARIPVPHPRM